MIKKEFRKNWNEFVLVAAGLASVVKIVNNIHSLKELFSSGKAILSFGVYAVSTGVIFGTILFWVWYFLEGRKQKEAV